MTPTNTDSFGRKHTYLRVSLTDRCNLSCSYCPPQSEFATCAAESSHRILNANEIVRFLTIMSKFPITKVRFTGGEPLLRKDICKIIERTKKINGIKKVCLTTNGTFLKNKALELKNAGLDSINISLDSLDSRRFKKITGSDTFYEVLDGIYLCTAYGLKVKINTVVLEDLTMEEVNAFVKFAIDNSIVVRFIEKMPFCGMNFALNNTNLLARIEEHITKRHGFTLNTIEGVARTYNRDSITIGFISPISNPFCSDCNRLRLSSNGLLYRCLFDAKSLDIKPFLDNGTEHKLLKYISQFLLHKMESHSLNLNKITDKFRVANSMRFIGG